MAPAQDAAADLPQTDEPRSGAAGRGLEAWRSRASDHFDVERQQFFNPEADTDRSIADLLRWWSNSPRRSWPRQIEPRSFAAPPETIPRGAAGVTHIGHATALLRIGDRVVLTDPVFSSHAGPLGRFGPPRIVAPGIALADLPRVDLVFVSHSHYDHLDVASLRQLERRHAPLFVTCLGLKRSLTRWGLGRVVELDWWEQTTLGDLTLTATPAQHWSKRGLFDLRRSLWGGCYLQAPGAARVFFAGDTGYASHFTAIRERLGAPDLALLPIGAYEPRWFMRDAHMNPDDAVRAHRDLAARVSIPIHYGTFRLTDEGFAEPLEDLTAALTAQGLSLAAFRRLAVGESAVLPLSFTS
jgi:L-ascorbate metabolism protein UlaG (beta-lactamase superfamily)